MEIDYSIIGKRIANKRNQLGLTQMQLSEMINISTTHMSDIERAVSKPSLRVLAKLSKIFHTSLDYLVLGIPDSEIKPEMDNIYQELLELSPEDLKYLKIFLDTLKNKNSK